jgi:hypothetical protein
MDLEHLTKHQIVLLTLLVSFVTSIATGIVTVSLMDQAPVGITRVVNQIVEHTVEQVVPKTEPASVAAATVEKTVVVKDDDLAATSIASVQKGVIRIVEKGSDTLIARGVITGSDGSGVTDRGALTNSGARKFEAILASGERVALTVVPTIGASPIAQITVATTSGFTAVTLADPAKLALGQSVIRISGLGQDTVGSGVIAMLPSGASSNALQQVQASVSSATPGSVLLTLFGEVIGITTSDSSTDDIYTVPARAPPAADEGTS